MRNKAALIFPDTLDNATVLYFTPKGDYGDLFNEDGTAAAHFSYLAICKYDGDSGFYLFKCNENFEVETDDLFNTIEECMQAETTGSIEPNDIHWNSKTDEYCSDFRLAVEVTFFSSGRKNLPTAGYRPDAVFEGFDESEQWCIYFMDLDADAFDKPVPARIRFGLQTHHYHQVRVGQRFVMREGPKVVGEGRIVDFLVFLKKYKRSSHLFYEMLLSDGKPEPVYKCPSCGKKGFAFDHEHPDPKTAGDDLEACRVCGLPSFIYKNKKNRKLWKESWKENGAKTVSEMPLPERMDYVDTIYDCEYRKEYVVPSEDDIKNRRLDKRIFTDNQRKLPFVKDDSKLTITNDIGEKWEFPYETNRFFELDDDKRCVMLIEECGYARLLASDYLAVRESPRLSYPGLTPDVFGFVGVFVPDCVFEDIEGTIYTATVRLGKGSYVFKDDEFHKKVVALCERIEEFINTMPEGDRRLGMHQMMISDLKSMDKHGDPSRYKPQSLISVINYEKRRPPEKRYLSDELVEELSEMVEEYKALKRV